MAIWLAVLAGMVVGGGMAEGFGALAGGLLGWLWVRTVQQGREIRALKEARAVQPGPVVAERAQAAAEATPFDPVWPGPEEADLPPPQAAAPHSPAARAEVEDAPGLPVSLAPQAPAAVPEPAMAAVREPAPVPRWLSALKVGLFGGNTIVKAGVAILFIGLAFLAKYASERVTLPVELRLAGIATVALVLLVLGWRLRLRRAGYAQVLQGGAVAVLYLTLFVAFRFYGVVGAGPVFGLMVVVAALAAALAVLQDARSLAVVGALGGFATPLLVSSGGGDQVALFAYYLVLDLGIAAVAWFRTWRVLNLVGFGFTFLIGAAWGVMDYRPEHYASSQAFLVAFFLLFVAVLLMPARRGHPGAAAGSPAAPWVNGSLLFGLPTVSFALQYGLVQHLPYGVALSALVLAAFYVAVASRLRRRPELGLAFDAALAIATVFLTLVIPFALDARSTAGAWALEGAGLVWLGLRQARRLPRAFGYLLLLGAGLAMAWGDMRFGAPQAVFNAHLFNALLLAAGALVAAWAWHRHGQAAGAERLAEPVLIGWACLWMASAAEVQIDHFLPAQLELAGWMVAFSSMALGLVLLGRCLAWPQVAVPAMAHAPWLMLALAAGAAQQDHPLQGGGAWAWPLALAVHAGLLRWAVPAWPAPVRTATHALGALAVAGLGALLGRALTRSGGEPDSAWPWLGWVAVPVGLLLLFTRPGLRRLWPVNAEPQAYGSMAAGVIAAGLWAWTLAANAFSDGAASPLPHVPLLNPLDLGIALALAAVALWLRGQGAAELLRQMSGGLGAERATRWCTALIAAAVFMWLNAMLIRAFHHLGGVPFHLKAWADSFAVQTGITLLWTVTALALMWGAARRAARWPWAVGAALLGAVVLKLVAVDLAGSGTVTRIVSFIGVGVLMLVIGYVAPWPAQKEATRAAG